MLNLCRIRVERRYFPNLLVSGAFLKYPNVALPCLDNDAPSHDSVSPHSFWVLRSNYRETSVNGSVGASMERESLCGGNSWAASLDKAPSARAGQLVHRPAGFRVLQTLHRRKYPSRRRPNRQVPLIRRQRSARLVKISCRCRRRP